MRGGRGRRPAARATADDADEWTVTPPTFRPDLIREVDLIEEVGRIAGYGMAPETLPRHTTAGGLTKPQQVRRAVRRALAGCGLDEVITYIVHRPRRASRRSACPRATSASIPSGSPTR